jgi:hypothetical protein
MQWASGHGKVKLFKGFNNPNGWGKKDQWWYSHTWWEYHVGTPDFVRAHEFGHLIGMYDEYPQGACDPARLYTDEPTSIKNAGTRVSSRHVKDYVDWFKKKAEPTLGEMILYRLA